MKHKKTAANSKISRILFGNISLIVITLLSAIFRAILSMEDGIELNVETIGNWLSRYRDYHLSGENHFVSGLNGSLYWYPKSLSEALILNTVKGDGADIYHVLLLSVFALVFYYMLSASKDNKLFTNKVTTGFICFVLLLVACGLLDEVKFIVVNEYVRSITNQQFDLQLQNTPAMFYYILGLMLIFLNIFPAKAQELQDEQSLTI